MGKNLRPEPGTALKRDESGHIIPKEMLSYNERLFNGGIRGFLHTARFRWLRKSLLNLGITSGTVLELGCFDGKTLDYLPFTPTQYIGFDADWEGGLALAEKKWGSFSQNSFIKSATLADFNPTLDQFDISIAMETMEHLPLAELHGYMEKLRLSTKNYLFISVPVEKGPIPVFKNLAKRFFYEVDEPYTPKELLHALTGNMCKVGRVELGHKGFNYSTFINDLSAYFDILEVTGLPLHGITPWLNFSVGIVAHPKILV